MKHCATGPYRSIILDITPKARKKVPPSSRDEIQNFLSQFGPIITTYFLDNTKSRRTPGISQQPDHIYIVFENENSITDISTQWAQQGTFDFWKVSWDIAFRIEECPKILLDHIKSVVTGESSSIRNYQKAGKEERNTPVLTNLKRDRTSQAEGDALLPEVHKRPRATIDKIEANNAEPSIPEQEVDRLRSEVAHFQSQHKVTWREREVARSECERYRAERDEARIRCERYRGERDTAIAKGAADAAACQQLKRQVDELKRALEDKNEGLRSVMAVVRTSLEVGLEPGQLEPSPVSPRLLYS